MWQSPCGQNAPSEIPEGKGNLKQAREHGHLRGRVGAGWAKDGNDECGPSPDGGEKLRVMALDARQLTARKQNFL